MNELRNAGFLQHDFAAGNDVTAYIYDQIRQRRPNWKADELHFLELHAAATFTFEMDGFTWTATDGAWIGSNCRIKSLVVNEDVAGLKMAFRYDD